jgi:NAD(P)-dependent dehydrogenase (short-subunit alcohol dehydrogenase family)
MGRVDAAGMVGVASPLVAGKAKRQFRLAGRVVIVSGADTESGATAARACATDGAALVLVGDDARAIGVLAAELLAADVRCALFVGDPRDDAERAALAELVSELYGRDDERPDASTPQ